MQKIKDIFKRMGPAFLTTTTVFGPASVLMSAIAGAKFGYACNWVLILLLVDRVLFMDVGTRIGFTHKTTFGDAIREKLSGNGGKVFSFVACLTIAIPLLVYTSADALGTAQAFNVMFDGNILLYGLFFMACAIGIVLYKKSYKILEKTSVIFMCLMFVCFLVTLVITGIDFGAFLKGFIPDFSNTPAMLYSLAIFLTNSSQQGVIHQYIVKQNNYSKEDVTSSCKTDNNISTVFVILIIGMIIATSAQTLGKTGEVPASAPAFAKMLEPAVGSAAKYFFGLGLFGAAMTSLNGAPNGTGLAIADAIGKLKNGYEDKLQKIITIVAIVVMGLYGVLPAYFGWTSPLNIYMIASLMTALTIPICGTMMLVFCADKERMKDLPYSKARMVVLWAIFIFIVCFCTYNFLTSYVL